MKTVKELAAFREAIEGLNLEAALKRHPRQRNREAHTGDKLWAGGKAERIERMELRALR